MSKGIQHDSAKMGSAWDTDTVAEAYNVFLVDKAMYAGIVKQLATSEVLAQYYAVGQDSFARSPHHLFCQQLLEMTMNKAYTLLCMLTGETQRIPVSTHRRVSTGKELHLDTVPTPKCPYH